MSRQEAVEQYNKALKLGQKAYKDSVLHGRYPYPQVLDDILPDDSMVAGRVDLGVIEIPTELIVGTKTAGRRSAFAENFMPLLDPDSEFGYKWMDLCTAHLGDEGIRDPIRCYEYFGRFYVQEGNKRVSVLKSYGAPTVSGYVIRVVPRWSEDPVVRIYYEFMASYQMSGLYQVSFTRLGSFAKLQAALGYEPDHVWTEEDQKHFLSGLTYFRAPFRKLGGGELPITEADALLLWLRLYPFDMLKTASSQELLKTLTALWPDVKVLASPEPIAVSTAPPEDSTASKTEEKEGAGLLGRLFKAMFPGHLNVAFINERRPEESDWARAHDLGRQYLEAVMGEKVDVHVFDGVRTGAEEAIETAVKNGAQVIFATTPPLITACRKAAVKYPNVRILNCSVSMPYTGVRTYYSRIYESKFITGAIAGAMSPDGRIGYVASNPIFGVPASINAFALGARLTNPRARIQLKWSCVSPDPMGDFIREGVTVLSNRDLPTPDRVQEPWGLCHIDSGGSLRPLASPYWHWGNFYVKIIRSIFNGGWDTLNAKDDRPVNYWWGMSSRVVDVLLSPDLPDGVRQLVNFLQDGIIKGSIEPFRQKIRDQEGKVRNDGEQWFSPEEVLYMDWLCEYVDGGIPIFPELLPMSRSIVRLQGVYRDQIPPEKEAPLL
ncbi:MAG: BMP family ABC transporter substrate-binding protein [Oscillospiraceae bacterium]|nr:BMP family ABC transporter substrate-binding protein [Oscillospiraceae bacterium]